MDCAQPTGKLPVDQVLVHTSGDSLEWYDVTRHPKGREESADAGANWCIQLQFQQEWGGGKRREQLTSAPPFRRHASGGRHCITGYNVQPGYHLKQ